MEPDRYDLEFVRKPSYTGTHWELRCVNKRTQAAKAVLIDGFPMNFVYVAKDQSATESDSFISTDVICNISQEQAEAVERVAAAVPIQRPTLEEYRLLISEGKKPWSCQAWTVEVLAGLEAEDIVPHGISDKLRGHIGDKGSFPDDRTWKITP